MTKVSRITKVTVADIMKQKKLEMIKKAKERQAEIQRIKDQEFDTFVRNTARDMIKDSFKFELKIFNSPNVFKEI